MSELDPRIILSGQNPVYEPIGVAAQRAQTLRGAMLANDQAEAVNPQIQQENELKLKLGAESLKQEALKSQQAQADFEDQAKLRALLKPATPPAAAIPGAPVAAAAPMNWDDIYNQYAQSGAQPKNVFALQQMILGNKEKAAQLMKTQGEVATAKQKLVENENDLFAGLANGIKQTGYNPVALEAALHAAEQVNPEYKQHTDAIRQQIAAGVPIQQIIDPIVNAASSTMKTAFAHQQQADTTAANQKLEAPIKVAEAGQKQTALAGQLLGPATNQQEWEAALAKLPTDIASQYPAKFSPSAADLARRRGMSAEQQTQADQAAATLSQTVKRDAETANYHRGELGIQGGRLGLEQQRFNATLGAGLDANGRPLSGDEAKAAAQADPVAVAIANYQVPPPGSRTSALGKATMAKVLALNPTYDGSQFAARNKTAMDFSAAGKSGQTLTSTDTALSHLGLISKAGEALNNGNFPMINKIANELGLQVGATPKNTYDTIVATVGPEISKAVIGGVGGEQERQALQQRFSSSLSPQQREQALAGVVNLLGARYDKTRQAYESTMGKPLDRKLSSESQQLLQKYTSGSKPAVAVAPGGGYRQTATGPGGHKIGTNDGKTWFDVQTGKQLQ